MYVSTTVCDSATHQQPDLEIKQLPHRYPPQNEITPKPITT